MEILLKLKLGLPLFINTFFLFAFFVHVTFIGYRIKYPETPSVKVFTKSFNELDEFPMSFILCVSELKNSHDRYKKFGYDDIWSFYRGNLRYYKGMAYDDSTLVGWAGNTTVKGGYYINKTKHFLLQ